MKTPFLMMMLIGVIAFAGCTKANEATETPTQQPATAAEPTSVPPTNTPSAEVTATTVRSTNTPLPEPTETAVPLTNAPRPEPTETAVPPTHTAQPEPTETAASTATPIPEPTATAIPCNGVLTSPNQEGPYYSPGSPERPSLIDDGMPGVPMLIVGRVFDQDCSPLAGAKLDFWLADVNGEYDNVGYRLRGYTVTDANGNYALESIEPTSYTGRPPHIHVKVFAPDGRELLTTQMYFSGSEGSSDVNTSPDLLATYLEPDDAGRQQALFSFVVQNQ